jgi:hypothetical protein
MNVGKTTIRNNEIRNNAPVPSKMPSSSFYCSAADPGSGIQDPLPFLPLDPESGIRDGKKSRSGINIPDHFLG